MNHRIGDASRVLLKAYKQDIWQSPVTLDPNMVHMIEAVRGRKKTSAPYRQLDQKAQALNTRVNTLGKTPVFDAGSDHLIELARVVVPDGSIGYLENIEQYVADANGAFYATQSQYWGMPLNETVPYGDITWCFRLDEFRGIEPPRFNITSPVITNFRSLLPGEPWGNLPEFQGLWYPATQQTEFRATVPSAKILRLIVFVPSSTLGTYSWRIVGRLTARTQSILCNEAVFNTRTTFK